MPSRAAPRWRRSFEGRDRPGSPLRSASRWACASSLLSSAWFGSLAFIKASTDEALTAVEWWRYFQAYVPGPSGIAGAAAAGHQAWPILSTPWFVRPVDTAVAVIGLYSVPAGRERAASTRGRVETRAVRLPVPAPRRAGTSGDSNKPRNSPEQCWKNDDRVPCGPGGARGLSRRRAPADRGQVAVNRGAAAVLPGSQRLC